ncbi:MAG: hypothetical protein AAB250_16885 [Bdellovibrionota bacterium]
MRSRIALALVLVVGFLSQGCSTPAGGYGQTYGDYEMLREEAWSAYNNCLEALGPYGRASECDDVSGTSQTGYQDRSGGYYQQQQTQTPAQYYGYYSPPPYYMWSAEPSDVDAMKQKWMALAEEPEKAL